MSIEYGRKWATETNRAKVFFLREPLDKAFQFVSVEFRKIGSIRIAPAVMVIDADIEFERQQLGDRHPAMPATGTRGFFDGVRPIIESVHLDITVDWWARSVLAGGR